MKALFLFLIILLNISSAFAQELSGTVENAEGKPIEKVAILGSGYSETDKEGRFLIKDYKADFLVFRKNGFTPKIEKITGKSSLKITLDLSNTNKSLKLPECSKNISGKKVGNDLILTVPDESKSKKGFDVDYGYFSISDDEKNHKYYIQGIYGPTATSGYPDRDWINLTEEIYAREIENDKGFVGYDYYGKTKDGKYWRWTQINWDAIYYSVDSAKVKDFFDNVINSSCTNFSKYSGK